MERWRGGVLVSADWRSTYQIAWQGNERVAVTDFDFEDLLRFKSRHLTGDMVEPLIRPR